MDEHSCQFCYYEYFNEYAYPCSMCVRGMERKDMFSPKGRRTKDEQTEPQTDYTPDCPFCVRYGTDECLRDKCRHYQTYKDEPQTDYLLPKECKGCDKHICVGCVNQALKEKWRKKQTDCAWK